MSAVTITITGHLADDPELRESRDGTSVTNFTVIANDRRKDESGEWVDASKTAIRITVWGKLAQHVVLSLTHGDKVTVTGHRLTADAFIGRDGDAKASLELTATTVTVDLANQTTAITHPNRQQA